MPLVGGRTAGGYGWNGKTAHSNGVMVRSKGPDPAGLQGYRTQLAPRAPAGFWKELLRKLGGDRRMT